MLKRLLLTSTLLVPSLSFACPNWQANIKNNQPVGWDYQLNPQNIEVVSDPQDAKSQVIKLTITPNSTWPNGHTRTELKHNGCATDEGESTFFSWEFYLDKQITTMNNIAYWETDKTYQQGLGLYLQPSTENGEKASELVFFSSMPSRKIHWQNTVNVAEWNKISLAIRWSKSEQSGHVSLWFNHQPILTQLAVQTKPDVNELFIQLGLHRNQSEETIDNIYLRNVIEAASQSQLLKR